MVFEYVALILKEWSVEDWAERNLIELYRGNRLRILNDYRIIPRIERKISMKSAKSTTENCAYAPSMTIAVILER